ncbi:hypothetical protein PGTUg99_001973 [Puccinia graminis f. sp. tritici]|uniref:Uncharacterized protein n=1 Tax=Puccinia graminis f. sp. tritici TaxID=56615 RepID=A0A5B0QLN0_PUCGR|nr:hypothetical protein PGTUg99_028598 [Puccinia graminis f. sp. tritici]KAA1113844.1 hypothetical protein PGTUg99_001973 [Puccinia graminis f. sp. tritici]
MAPAYGSPLRQLTSESIPRPFYPIAQQKPKQATDDRALTLECNNQAMGASG